VGWIYIFKVEGLGFSVLWVGWIYIFKVEGLGFSFLWVGCAVGWRWVTYIHTYISFIGIRTLCDQITRHTYVWVEGVGVGLGV